MGDATNDCRFGGCDILEDSKRIVVVTRGGCPMKVHLSVVCSAAGRGTTTCVIRFCFGLSKGTFHIQ